MYTPIVGTLAYIMSPDGESVLMIHRNAREEDTHLGKYNGLGGKLDPTEDVMTCIKREIMEEAGIEAVDVKLRGTINWTGFGKNGEDWMGFIFRVDSFTGTPKERNEEGELSWVKLADFDKIPMWDGDKHFLPLVFDSDPRIFHGYMPYDNDQPLDWQYTRI